MKICTLVLSLVLILSSIGLGAYASSVRDFPTSIDQVSDGYGLKVWIAASELDMPQARFEASDSQTQSVVQRLRDHGAHDPVSTRVPVGTAVNASESCWSDSIKRTLDVPALLQRVATMESVLKFSATILDTADGFSGFSRSLQPIQLSTIEVTQTWPVPEATGSTTEIPELLLFTQRTDYSTPLAEDVPVLVAGESYFFLAEAIAGSEPAAALITNVARITDVGVVFIISDQSGCNLTPEDFQNLFVTNR